MPANFSLEHGWVAGKKNGACCLPRCQLAESPAGPDLSVGGWLTCFVSKLGVGRGDFVTLIRVSSEKAVQSQGIFPVGQPSQINTVTHNHNTTSRPWREWLRSHKCHGLGGWVLALWTWLSRDRVQAPCMKSTQIYSYLVAKWPLHPQ